MPPWLLDILRCPEDAAPLAAAAAAAADGVRCERCGRGYAVDGDVLVLLPERLARLGGDGAPDGRTDAPDDAARWIDDELAWWDPWYDRDALEPLSPAGLRGRSRDRHLLRRVRRHVPPGGVVLEMGAGTSRTIAGLWPPARSRVRYVATDISLKALQGGRQLLGPATASVQCDANAWPFGEGVADLVLLFGVLHHLSDWRAALERAALAVRPGGLLALHEVIEKPRVLARWRGGGYNDAWVSPHEGDVPASEIRRVLERHGTVLRWRGEESPLRFALVKFLVERRGLYDVLDSHAALTDALNAADQLFGRGPGRLFPSLGFHEAMAIWRRHPA
jgi:SAM-dependent methyltransferase